MRKFIYYVFRSIQLDLVFLTLDASLFQKLEFIFKKYLSLFLILIPSKRNLAVRKTNIFECDFYYSYMFELSVLQMAFTDNFFLKDYINPSSTIIDIGANVGQFRFFSEVYLKAKKVYSFEPLSSCYSVLSSNFKEDIYHSAIGSGPARSAKIVWGNTTLTASLIAEAHPVEVNEEVINISELSAFDEIRNEASIDLLKIDVEGFEVSVLHGCKDVLQKTKYMLVESSLTRKSDGNLADFIVELKKYCPEAECLVVGRNFDSAVDMFFSLR